MPHFASNSLERFSPTRGRQRNRKPDIRTERREEEEEEKKVVTGFQGI